MIRVLGIYNFGTHTNKMDTDSPAKNIPDASKLSPRVRCQWTWLIQPTFFSTEVCSPTPNWNDFEYNEDLFG